MEPIKDIKLDALLTEADATIIEEKKRKALQAVRTLLIDEHKLKTDIEQAEKGLKKLNEQLSVKQAIIAKVKAGDWSALKDSNENVKKYEPGEKAREENA